MTKTIFDYESSDEEEKNTKKRTFRQFENNFDNYLSEQKTIIEDIEKHCRNKRLKKNIYKMDCLKLITSTAPTKDAVYNPGVTNASSDYEKLPRVINDPVIDSYFRTKTGDLFSDIMTFEGHQMIMNKGLHPENVFETDFCKTQKLADFEEFMASRRTSSSSPIAKKDEASYNIITSAASSGATNISMENSYSGLPTLERQNLLQNLHFFK